MCTGQAASTGFTIGALQEECARLLQQAPAAVQRRELTRRMGDVNTRLISAKANRSAVAVIASITREKATLTQALKDVTLSEEECRALPDGLRELDNRLFEFSVELSEASDFDMDTIDEVAKMQEDVKASLSALSREAQYGEKGTFQAGTT